MIADDRRRSCAIAAKGENAQLATRDAFVDQTVSLEPFRCKACEAPAASTIGSLGLVPLIPNVVYDAIEDARAAKSGAVELAACRACGFVWNAAFDPQRLTFDRHYENNQNHSSTFFRHVTDAAHAVTAHVSEIGPIHYLEIGCGQGVFLKAMIDCVGRRLETAEAFDPAWRGDTDFGAVPTNIYAEYFNSQSARKLQFQPNLIVFRHSFEYFERPSEVLRLVRDISADDARLFIETPSATNIIERNAIEDFSYERQNYFDQKCLSLLLSDAGWGALRFKRVFSDQYLWAFGSSGADPISIPSNSAPGEPGQLLANYKDYWTSRLHTDQARGKIGLWGAGAKGAMFSILNDPGGTIFDCAIDINPLRAGKFLPVSALQILSPRQALERDLKTIYVMNAAYLDEIRQQVSLLGIDAEIVSADLARDV